jgi:hypothetical protein
MTTNEPHKTIDVATHRAICALLGLTAEGVTKIVVTPDNVRVTMHRHNDEGKLYLGRVNETAKVIFDIAVTRNGAPA